MTETQTAHTPELDIIAHADCGCRVVRPCGTTDIRLEHCLLHGAATELLAALERIVVRATRPVLIGTVYEGVESLQACVCDIEFMARAAIAKATKTD